MTGTVVLSVEIELGWGLARLDDPPLERHDERRAAETETLGRLLDRCDELEIPITFDVVGHLLLADCDGEHDGDLDGDHDDDHDDRDGALPADWFADDPGSSVDEDPLYYAPDLIERIRDADVDHEIATHTFSHVRCDQVDDAIVDWELQAVRDAHSSVGLAAPRSFVPPIHGPPPSDVLREHGLTGVREVETLRSPVTQRPTPDSVLRSAATRLRRSHPVEVLGRSHPVREPELRDGLVRHYTTWHASLTAPFLPNGRSEPHRVYRLLPTAARQRLHERYLGNALDDAVAADSCVHLWTHLYNLSNDAQWPPVRSFLERVAARRDAEDATVSTMESLSERVRAAQG